MTVLEILNRTKVFFEKKGIPDARLDAEYIISYGLKMKNRMDLYLNFEKPLTPAELDVLRTMVARRATREPLQHIIGDTSFRGFIIKCDRRALIPRPETESLVDMASDSLKGIEKPFIVEIGTGTGAISIACAKEIAGAKVLATDVSEDALTLARTNAEANDLAGNPDAESAASSTDSTASASSASSANAASTLTFAQGDLLNAITADVIANVAGDASAKIDCLIANLPYIPDSEKDKLQPEVAKYDPALALFGGADGRPKASSSRELLFCSKSGRNKAKCSRPKPRSIRGWNSRESTKIFATMSALSAIKQSSDNIGDSPSSGE